MNNQQFQQWLHHYATNFNIKKMLIMGILNVTPDSFSDGGQFNSQEAAFTHAMKMIDEGADLIDVGGESSRPGALPVSVDEEMSRVIPLIERIRQHSDICLSIDTTKAVVMREALTAGASVINDISALSDPAALDVVVTWQVPVCLMHLRGTPAVMQQNTDYSKDIIDEVNNFFSIQVQRCLAAGIKREQLILDPGFGFGKTVHHNLKLVKYINRFKHHGVPLLLGVSRKSTLGKVLNKEVNERMIGGVVAAVFARLNGVAILRTHDVEETSQALRMSDAITQCNEEQWG